MWNQVHVTHNQRGWITQGLELYLTLRRFSLIIVLYSLPSPLPLSPFSLSPPSLLRLLPSLFLLPGGDAEAAGVCIGDVVLEVNGQNCREGVAGISVVMGLKMLIQQVKVSSKVSECLVS